MVEIGVPRGAPAPAAAGLISERVLALVPSRPRDGSKFSSGTVVVAGGAGGLTGAPTMAALAAQRTGAGYVQVAVPRSVALVLELKLLEAMTHALPDEDEAHVPAGAERIEQLAERAGAIALGPGLGRSDGAQEFAREVARRVQKPLLIDADGLNAHAGRLDLLAGRPGPTVLTPHAGELARLLGTDSADIAAHRLARARTAAEESGCVVVLKGDDSIVAAPGGPLAISPGATPALATAGTGDVLSGIVGHLPGQGPGRVRGRGGRRARPRPGGPGGRGAPRGRPHRGGRRDRGATRGAEGGSMTHAPERAVARIDLGAVERNCAHLRSLLGGGAELCAVVKANAYGHGDVWCAKAALAGGAGWLAVATAGEAAELRRHGIASRILTMGALTHEEARLAVEAAVDVVIWDPDFARALAELHPRGAAPLPVHVKLDSGMGRLGTKDLDTARALAELAAADERLELAGLMTHFATADELDDDHFAAQLATFEPFASELKQAHPGLIVHASNSAATYRDQAAHFDLVRCGIAVYGLDPFGADSAARGLEPALSLESYVAAVKRFEPGDSAGYGRRWRATRAHLGGHAADRLRRRLAAGAVEQLRRADRRAPLPGGGHGQHGQHHRRPGPGHRR